MNRGVESLTERFCYRMLSLDILHELNFLSMKLLLEKKEIIEAS